MIMPFLLNQFLKESSLKHNEAVTIQQRINASRISLVPKNIIACWVHVAKTMRIVFNRKFTSDSYKELQQYGSIDPRFNRSCTGFTNSNFGQLFLNWYITENKYLIEEQAQDNDDTKVVSPVNFISNISLKKRMSKQKRDSLLLTLHNFKTELFLSYVDMKFEAALMNISTS
ncbi:hypothetical protein RclHR1_03840009 [Rhizophagus clarus]|uniref:Uncharacterized protein n=1 Tax=Rhizophagus clarus TaxID=94130 RepID=A0A2Z6S7Q1_9GLOM|nr:hypothetical protein RclHR1_03840009 [Rhizophagus clarus]